MLSKDALQAIDRFCSDIFQNDVLFDGKVFPPHGSGQHTRDISVQ